MRVLIDADIVAYSCGFAAQKTYYDLHNGTITRFEKKSNALAEQDICGGIIIPVVLAEDVSHALSSAKKLIARCMSMSGADEYDIYLTGDNNFRDRAVTYYKENRKENVKPVHYEALREYLLNVHGAIVVDGQEADDRLAQEQWAEFVIDKKKATTCIATIDKDLNMIPGWHYNWRKNELYWQDMAPAMYFFYTQLLTGDAVDNIKGVKGVGPKTAEKILKGAGSEKDLYNKVLMAYVRQVEKALDKQNLMMDVRRKIAVAEAMLDENAQLLWMRREEGVAWVAPTGV